MGPKIKKRKRMVFEHRGGGQGVTQNKILIQTSFYSGNLAIFSATFKKSE